MAHIKIPQEVSRATEDLKKSGFEAFLVGGCVRDLVMGRRPKDWDITTNAKPWQIEEIFKHTFYNNKYGTVTVVNESTKDETLRNIEITPYRREAAYSDKRHPDEVSFSDSLEEDLKRRDFTINSIAYDPDKRHFADPHKGQADIASGVIRAVGDPGERVAEDALRMLRAVRLATELEFSIDERTSDAIRKNAAQIKDISAERVRDELSKILLSRHPREGILLLEAHHLLGHMIPELREGIGIEQRGEHIYDVFEHNLRSLEHAGRRDWSFHVRLAALLHDVAKPDTREWDKQRKIWTFHGHDVVGSRMTKDILRRLKFSRETIDVVSKLVRYHLFFSDVEKITLSAVRRLLRNVGKENIWELMKLRYCDRIGTGRPKETPYRLRKYESMIEEVMRDPITVGMLKIDGGKIMELTGIEPGPKIGYILHILLEEVLDDPSRNTEEYLNKRAIKLAALSDSQLEELGRRAKQKMSALEEEEIREIRKRHWVK